MRKYTAKNIVLQLKGRWTGQQGLACCPAHDDQTPSLSVTEKNGKILWHCFAGCNQSDVQQCLAELGLLPQNGRRDG